MSNRQEIENRVIQTSEVTPLHVIPLSLALSPNYHLYLYEDNDQQELIPKKIAEKIYSFFDLNDSLGLLRLGLTHFEDDLPRSIYFWWRFSQLFISEVCKQARDHIATQLHDIHLLSEDVDKLINTAPFMRGSEHLNQEAIHKIWQNLIKTLTQELKSYDSLEAYLNIYHAAWNTVGRVCFHLAENKANPVKPFAFLATYTTHLSKTAQAQHLPLGRALEEYADQNKKSLLLSLLLPVQRAAEKSIFLKNLMDTRKIFQPLAWEAREAYQFLKDIPLFEAAGVIIKVPNWWNPKKPARPSVKVTIGNKKPSTVGLDALLDFNIDFALPSGQKLTTEEFKQLLHHKEQLIQIKGQWIQVDSEKLNQVLSHWKTIERRVRHEGLSFAEGLRLLAGMSNSQTEELSDEEVSVWSSITEGDYLNDILHSLRHPEINPEKSWDTILEKYLRAELRPYQQRGVQWLRWLYQMRLGGCLADDMGLGKTIQVLSLLLLIKYQKEPSRRFLPHLLVLPASLLGNWQAEIQRFAPTLRSWIAHSSSLNNEKNLLQVPPDLSQLDIVMTTYNMLHRLTWLKETAWDVIILDEAQAIKNPTTKQARMVKQLKCSVRFILTGTPVENRLLDLWSLFDFVAPGLLGGSRAFAGYSKQKNSSSETKNQGSYFNATVRRLISPYILRRLKSDKTIISDLPDKTEMQTYCALTKEQVRFYQQAVNELATQLEESPSEGIQRRGLVLSYLLRFKQICNHPHQWLGHGEYEEELSGKFIRLRELCTVIAEKQEKVLIFTQFREIMPALCNFLTRLFKKEGLFLHGQTTLRERAKRLEAFQQEQGPPFFVLSLKAGGTGLNLTHASHVIHFDRWWNPAVENQATDRAYRIGQKRNVLVHKFICRGTIEEKIDALIHSKKSLSEEIITQDKEINLTELSDAELLKIVKLDIHQALGEN